MTQMTDPARGRANCRWYFCMQVIVPSLKPVEKTSSLAVLLASSHYQVQYVLQYSSCRPIAKRPKTSKKIRKESGSKEPVSSDPKFVGIILTLSGSSGRIDRPEHLHAGKRSNILFTLVRFWPNIFLPKDNKTRIYIRDRYVRYKLNKFQRSQSKSISAFDQCVYRSIVLLREAVVTLSTFWRSY